MDAKQNAEARECLLRLYPHAPAGDVEIILHAWQRNSGRVGRTPIINLESKTDIAVRAHVRHNHSSHKRRIHEGCRKQGVPRISGESLLEIRRQSNPEIRMVLNSWRGLQISVRRIPPGASQAALVVGVLAPIRNSELSSIEHPAPEQNAYLGSRRDLKLKLHVEKQQRRDEKLNDRKQKEGTEGPRNSSK